MKVLIAIILLLLSACGHDVYHTPVSLNEPLSEPEYGNIVIIPKLSIGTLGHSGEFNINEENEVLVKSDQELFQVSLKIEDLGDLDPNFLRIEFTSDFIEWVGMSNSGTFVYDSEENCWLESFHCDPVEVGAGTSGYFRPTLYTEDYIGIQNAYCRIKHTDYSYSITAVVYTLEYYDPVYVSDHHSIEIQCLQDHDTTQISDQ